MVSECGVFSIAAACHSAVSVTVVTIGSTECVKLHKHASTSRILVTSQTPQVVHYIVVFCIVLLKFLILLAIAVVHSESMAPWGVILPGGSHLALG